MKQKLYKTLSIQLKLLLVSSVLVVGLVGSGLLIGRATGQDGLPYNTQPATLSSTSATIVWRTKDPADSKIVYGINTGYGLTQTGGTSTSSHSLMLQDLEPGTTYHYKVGNSSDTSRSGDHTFTTPHEYGVLTSSAGAVTADTAKLDELYQKGVRIHSIDLAWDAYEPTDNNFSAAYINAKKAEIAAYKARGFKIVLETGAHYTPAWVRSLEAAAVYRNQYGNTYAPNEPGKNIANGVFSNAVRSAMAEYHERVLADLGMDFYAVRVGGGYYGELHYPDQAFSGRTNSYWGYDANAQNGTGLPSGIAVNPVPGWIPNPVKNGTFENGADGNFTLSGTDSVIASGANRGTRSLRKVNPGAWSNQTTQTDVQVVSGTVYRYSVWAKSTNGSAPACIQIKRPNGDELSIQCTGNSNFTQLSNTFTAQDSTIEIALLTYDGANTTLTYDDVSIMANGYTYDATNANATSFWNWYRDSLTNYQNWQIDTYRNAGYDGKLFVLYPSFGVRSEASVNQVTQSIGYDLSLTSAASLGGDMQQATDWKSQIEALPSDDDVIAYTTWIDGSGSNASANRADWSAAKYLAYLADQEDRTKWGENTGSNSYTDMQRTFQHVSEFGYAGILWFNETQLYGGVHATADNYGTQIVQHDETAPYQLSLAINGGQARTDSKSVVLTIGGTDNVSITGTTEVIYSENPNFIGAIYEPLTPTKPFTLSGGYGEKIVYLALKDAAGNISNTYQARVDYVETPHSGSGTGATKTPPKQSKAKRQTVAQLDVPAEAVMSPDSAPTPSQPTSSSEESIIGSQPYSSGNESSEAEPRKYSQLFLIGSLVAGFGVVLTTALFYVKGRNRNQP